MASLFCGCYGFSAKLTGTAKDWAFCRTLFHQQRVVAVLALTGDGFKIEDKLTFRVAIAGVENLTIA
jgi:aspartate/methionine/tyrosine aminotransferase